MSTLYNRIDDNNLKTVIFIAIFILFFLGLIYLVDIIFLNNHWVITAAVIFIGIFSYSSYFFSDRYILKQNKAVPLDPKEDKALYNLTENICITAGIPIPQIYVIDDPAINAFAVGKNENSASIALTTGALSKLNEGELEGVISHEVAHIENHDILLSTMLAFTLGIVRSIVNIVKHFFYAVIDMINSSEPVIRIFLLVLIYGALSAVVFMILIIMLIPVIEEIIFYHIARKREFLADAEGALFTRYPDGLIDAFKKIKADDGNLRTINAATAHLYIVSPYEEKIKNFWSNLFHSHPPIDDRIEALEQVEKYGSNEERIEKIKEIPQ